MELDEIPKDLGEDKYVIRKMSLPHCAKGPKGCKKCAEAAKDKKIYLLKVYADPGTMARPIIEVNIHGEKFWQVYDVVQSFATEKQAKEHAKKNGLNLIE